ncbi:reverse transcriptase [Lasius niger]|uniref:Reverse transcriptase n=1 Tax=Lasius niger TaxID=67767 RepID=A0A0J7KKE7_LASNI|nr:reverse transcriptase [Lasius niger]
MTNKIGQDLSLPAIVEAMLGSEEAWRAMISFCGRVMTQKEIAEREREYARGNEEEKGSMAKSPPEVMQLQFLEGPSIKPEMVAAGVLVGRGRPPNLT